MPDALSSASSTWRTPGSCSSRCTTRRSIWGLCAGPHVEPNTVEARALRRAREIDLASHLVQGSEQGPELIEVQAGGEDPGICLGPHADPLRLIFRPSSIR